MRIMIVLGVILAFSGQVFGSDVYEFNASGRLGSIITQDVEIKGRFDLNQPHSVQYEMIILPHPKTPFAESVKIQGTGKGFAQVYDDGGTFTLVLESRGSVVEGSPQSTVLKYISSSNLENGIALRLLPICKSVELKDCKGGARQGSGLGQDVGIAMQIPLTLKNIKFTPVSN